MSSDGHQKRIPSTSTEPFLIPLVDAATNCGNFSGAPDRNPSFVPSCSSHPRAWTMPSRSGSLRSSASRISCRQRVCTGSHCQGMGLPKGVAVSGGSVSCSPSEPRTFRYKMGSDYGNSGSSGGSNADNRAPTLTDTTSTGRPRTAQACPAGRSGAGGGPSAPSSQGHDRARDHHSHYSGADAAGPTAAGAAAGATHDNRPGR